MSLLLTRDLLVVGSKEILTELVLIVSEEEDVSVTVRITEEKAVDRVPWVKSTGWF